MDFIHRSSSCRLPRLALIADRFTEAGITDRTIAAVKGGVRWVHLRDHVASKATFAESAERLVGRLRTVNEDVLLSVNSHVAVAEALEVGLHLGARGPSVEEGRARMGEDALVGFSAHDEREGRRAVQNGAEYLFFSPIFSTDSKPGHPGQGLDALEHLCATFPEAPVVALGGITPERAPRCLKAGAHGVAVLSGILHAADPKAATQAYLQALPDE